MKREREREIIFFLLNFHKMNFQCYLDCNLLNPLLLIYLINNFMLFNSFRLLIIISFYLFIIIIEINGIKNKMLFSNLKSFAISEIEFYRN